MNQLKNRIDRRQILQWSALASSALIIGCGSDNPAAADAGTDTPNPNDTSSVNPDLAPLNALLAAEIHAIKAYDAGAGILSAPPMGDPQAANAGVILAVAGRFQQQHRDHAAALRDVIMAAGGTPVAESTVTFEAPAGFTPGVVNVMKLACNAEKGAAIAYNQVLATMNTPAHRFLAGSIQGDESQHFIALYVLLKGVAQAGMNIATGLDFVVETSFVATVGSRMGLRSDNLFTYA